MGFVEALTIVLVLLKAVDVISWPWLYVFLPEMVTICIYIISFIIICIMHNKQKKKIFTKFDRW